MYIYIYIYIYIYNSQNGHTPMISKIKLVSYGPPIFRKSPYVKFFSRLTCHHLSQNWWEKKLDIPKIFRPHKCLEMGYLSLNWHILSYLSLPSNPQSIHSWGMPIVRVQVEPATAVSQDSDDGLHRSHTTGGR